MTYKYTVGGLNFIERVIADSSYTETMNTIAIGDGDAAPSRNDTTLDNQLHEAPSSSQTVIIERGTGVGEIRTVIEFTGGSEVPSGSDITEFGLKASDGTLLYRELRDTPITVTSGETKIVEIQIFVDDLDSEPSQVITNVGRNEIADMIVGQSSETLDTIAIGNSTNDVSRTDTSMYSELYRADNTSSNITVTTTSNTGDIRAEATISAGTGVDDEVDGGENISEFGLFSNGTLMLHETRPAITLESNDTKTFKIPFTIRQ